MGADPLLVNGNDGRESPEHASRCDDTAQGPLSRSVPSSRRKAPIEACDSAARRRHRAPARSTRPTARSVIARSRWSRHGAGPH